MSFVPRIELEIQEHESILPVNQTPPWPSAFLIKFCVNQEVLLKEKKKALLPVSFFFFFSKDSVKLILKGNFLVPKFQLLVYKYNFIRVLI